MIKSNTREIMNNLAEKLAGIFGSAPFIILHVIWFSIWIILNFIFKFDEEYSILTIVVSLEAIFLALFILRAENIQSGRLEEKLKEDLKKSKKEAEDTKKIMKKLKISK